MDDLDKTIRNAVFEIAREKRPGLADVAPDAMLREQLGFNSLDLATLVAVLEGTLGVDPFAKLVGIASVRTVADLCQAYRAAKTAP